MVESSGRENSKQQKERNEHEPEESRMTEGEEGRTTKRVDDKTKKDNRLNHETHARRRHQKKPWSPQVSVTVRSEEGRVGKEGRSGWLPYH